MSSNKSFREARDVLRDLTYTQRVEFVEKLPHSETLQPGLDDLIVIVAYMIELGWLPPLPTQARNSSLKPVRQNNEHQYVGLVFCT